MPLTESQITTLLSNVATSLKYLPYIYREVYLASNASTPYKHYIKHKSGILDTHSVLFFIPGAPSQLTTTAQIGLLQPGDGYDTTTAKMYKIRTIVASGIVDLQDKFLHPDRLYMLILNNDSEVLVINYSFDDAKTFNSLTATTIQANSDIQKMVDGNYVSVATVAALNTLAQRVTALENQIKIGTAPAEQELEGEPADTIYIKVEDL
jgi:hypothetical protein